MFQETQEMNWSMQSHKHYSAEHLHKVDKRHLGQNVEKEVLPIQKGSRNKHRTGFQLYEMFIMTLNCIELIH